MPPQDDRAALWDMLAAADKVREFVRGRTFDEYMTDELLQVAVDRKIEIVGEAARHVSAAGRAAAPDIPWRAITAQRYILAHEYSAVQQDRVWRVATRSTCPS